MTQASTPHPTLSRLMAGLLSLALLSCGGGGGDTSSAGSTDTFTPQAVDTSTATLVGQRIGLSSDPTRRAEEIKTDVRGSTAYIETDGTQVVPVGLTGVTTLSRYRGSGFIMTNEGHLVTNAHVVRGSGLYTVSVEGRSRAVNAELVAVAECEDLAVLKLVSGAPYKPLSWYGQAPKISTRIGAAGFPADVSSTSDAAPYVFTEGIVNTDVLFENNYWSSADMFYHSADTAGGSSGGPVVELETGTVVGIHYAGSSTRQLALSNTTARGIIDQLLVGQDVLSIGFSGEMFYRYYNASGNLLGFGLNSQVPTGAVTRAPVGVWVRGVTSGGKAKKAGILPGDIISAIAGVRLDLSDNTLGTYCSALRSNNPNTAGRVLDVEIVRPKAGGFVCTGEINGRTLGMRDAPSTACPEAATYRFGGQTTGSSFSHPVNFTVTNGLVVGTGAFSNAVSAIGGTYISGVIRFTEKVTAIQSLYYYGTYNATTEVFTGTVNNIVNGVTTAGTWTAKRN